MHHKIQVKFDKGVICKILTYFELWPFLTKSISKIFKPKCVCLLTKMKDIKHIKTEFSFDRLGHAPGMGLGSTVGGRVREVKGFFSEIQPDLVCELLT